MPVFKIPKPSATSTRGPTSIRDSFAKLLGSSSDLTAEDQINVELAAGQIGQQQALAEKARQEAALLRDQATRGQRRDSDLQLAGAVMSGVDLPQFQDFGAYRRTGQMPSLTGETADVGPIQPKYQWTPDQQARMDRALASTVLGGQMKDVNPHTITQAQGEIQGGQIMEAVQREIDKGDYTRASARSQGAKPGSPIELFKPVGITGAMGSPTTGDVRTDNPMAQGEIARRAADVTLKGAQGQAALTRASRAGVRGGGGAAGQKAPVGYRFSSDGETLEPIPGGPKDDKSKPLPTQALKLQQAELDAIGTAAGITTDLAAIDKQIESGKLDLGLVNNMINKGRNLVGLSSEQSRNLASFTATLEKLRNDSLRLNKGVQTEGDAIRAWNELVSSINDPGVVRQRLGEIQRINDRAVDLRRMNIDQIRGNYGAGPLDVSGYTNQPPAVGRGSSDEWNGTERRKPATSGGAPVLRFDANGNPIK